MESMGRAENQLIEINKENNKNIYCKTIVFSNGSDIIINIENK